MANIKFSAFTQKVVQTNVDFLVGYTGADNVRITPAALGDGIYLPLGGGTMVGNIHFNDGINANFGGTAGAWELEIYTNVANDAYIKKTATSAGDLTIQNASTDGDIIFSSDDGSGGEATYFYLDGGLASGGELKTLFPDDSRIVFGDGADFNFYHDGTDSRIQNTTGHIRIINFADDSDIIFSSDDGAGGTTTYFKLDGSEGNTRVDKDFFFVDNAKAKFGSSGDLEIYHDGSDSYISDTGAGDLYIQGSDDIYITADNGEKFITCNTNDSVEIRFDNVKTFETTATGIQVTDEVSIGTSIIHTGDTDTKISFGTDEIVLTTAGADRMLVAPTGNIILGANGTQYGLVTIRQDGTSNNNGLAVVDPLNQKSARLWSDGTNVYLSSGATGTAVLVLNEGGGNVGIGTVTPQVTLDVDVGNADGMGVSFAGSIAIGEYQGVHFGYSEDANPNYRKSGIVFERTDASARGKIHILNNAQAGNNSAVLTDSRVTIQYDGNVGIGTGSPTATLQVVGLVEYADNAAALLAGLTAGAFYRTGDLLKVVH